MSKSKKLHYALLTFPELSPETLRILYQLMDENYNAVHYDTFVADLSKKTYIILFQDAEGEIVGFTSHALNPAGTGTDRYNILFSGDTIISPKAWGSFEIIRAWSYTAGRIAANNPDKKLYWYLISKGHRTYMFLPLFFKEFVPDLEPGSVVLQQILDATSRKMFSQAWDPERGVISFAESQGELKPELAARAYEKKDHPYVNLFLQKNPRFYQGEELACLTELAEANIKGFALRYFSEGLQNPIAL